MRVPLTWLAEYVSPPSDYADAGGGWDLDRLIDRLVMTGTEVEAVHRLGVASSEGFVLGSVKSVDRHPDADRLSVCRVDTGGGEARSIVCGAPNVDVGQIVPVALPGARLPNGQEIGRANLRGVESEGMILSETELAIGEDSAGIMVLGTIGSAGADLEPGSALEGVLPIAETVIELEVTPNRPDCLGIYGVAREVHAVTGGELAPAPWLYDVEPGEGAPAVEELASVAVEVPGLCPRFTARVFDSVKVGPSPAWLKARLSAAGQRPINNVVDITNYVMLLTAQPLHAFDRDRVPGGELTIRGAAAGESVQTLDEIEREMPEGTVVVCDRGGPVAIAGIMGGATTEVSEQTETVLLEVANWDGPDILRSSRRLALRSEASSRFEKQLHPALCERAQRIASRMLVEICGARLAVGTIDEAVEPPDRQMVPLRSEHTEAVLGMPIPAAEQGQILERLGCGPVEEVAIDRIGPPGLVEGEIRRDPEAVDSGPVLWAPIPPDRHYDLTREADLIEEVGRVHGLERLPARLPAVDTGFAGGLSREQELRRRVEDMLCSLGFHEIVGWSFADDEDLRRLGLEGPSADGFPEPVRIANPLSGEKGLMRTTLLGSLLEAASHNHARDVSRIALFESGRVYSVAPDDSRGSSAGSGPLAGVFPGATYGPPARERHRVAAVVVDALRPGGWNGTDPARGYYAVKAVLESLAQSLGLSLSFVPSSRPYLHPGRAAEVRITRSAGTVSEAGESIGWIGELHPRVASEWDLEDVSGFEIDLAPLIEASPAGEEIYEDVTSYPAVEQDLAVVVPEGVAAADVREAALRGGGSLLRSAEVFDVFRGEQLGDERKSLALRLEFRADDRTLTDEEVAGARVELEAAMKAIGGSIRE